MSDNLLEFHTEEEKREALERTLKKLRSPRLKNEPADPEHVDDIFYAIEQGHAMRTSK